MNNSSQTPAHPLEPHQHPPLLPQAKPAPRPQAGLRREGREAAIQFLFHLDFHAAPPTQPPADQPVQEAVPDADFWRLRSSAEDPDEPASTQNRPPIAPKARAFAESLVRGVRENLDQLDTLISKFSRNYQLSRLAAVDRNILRLAVYEILYNKEVPPVVAINEAIELAKQYGSEESGRFVNGLLDRIRAETPRSPREGSPRTPKT
jgi:N utilization substance protein B